MVEAGVRALRDGLTAYTATLGLPALRANAAHTRHRIEQSLLTKGVREAMNDFFGQIANDFERAAAQAVEIHDMMRAMYVRFANDHGLEPFMPPPFSVLKYQKEIERLERAYNTNFNTLWNMVSKAKFALMKRFFETVASRAKHVYDIANRDVESWLKAVMAPLETQVREHHLQLRRRLESIRRIHQECPGFLPQHTTSGRHPHAVRNEGTCHGVSHRREVVTGHWALRADSRPARQRHW